MKRSVLIFGLILFGLANLFAQQSDFPKLTGPYLGQKPPGTTPEIFAKGFISTENSEHGTVTFSPKGDEVFWATIFSNPFRKKIMYSKIVDGKWTVPEVATFSHGYNEGNPNTRKVNIRDLTRSI